MNASRANELGVFAGSKLRSLKTLPYGLRVEAESGKQYRGLDSRLGVIKDVRAARPGPSATRRPRRLWRHHPGHARKGSGGRWTRKIVLGGWILSALITVNRMGE